MPIRMLLLQARRADDPMREHEHRCFADRTGLAEEHVVTHDLCDGPPPLSSLARFDAISVGGSGEYYVSRGNLPQFDAFLEFLNEAVARSHPMFASCFGFQSLVRALGGELTYDPPSAEVGTFELTLTDDGRTDPLFGTLPARFMAQLGHKDRASVFPETALNMASSENCRFQALRIPDKPVWATQFHPELDRASNLERLRRYLRDYGPESPDEMAAWEARFLDSPESSSLLRRFLALVFA
jgi:GMP synthase (glutamine-hydrolysing)